MSKKNRPVSKFPVVSIALAGLTLTACTEHDLIGVWQSVDSGDGPYYFGHFAYFEDGRKCTVLFEYAGSGVETIAFVNQWSLDGDVVTITYGPNNSSIEEGYTSRSEVQELTESRFVYQLIESDYAKGDVGVDIRMPDVNPYRVCLLAYDILGMPHEAPTGKETS